jgi:hypothetical protein
VLRLADVWLLAQWEVTNGFQGLIRFDVLVVNAVVDGKEFQVDAVVERDELLTPESNGRWGQRPRNGPG